jgi:hypothetical protein
MSGKTELKEKKRLNWSQRIASNAQRLVESGEADRIEWPEFNLDELLQKANCSRQIVKYWEA